VEAFNRLGLPLIVVGDGTRRRSLRQAARSNIEFKGKVDRATLLTLYQNCRAFVMPQIEDFGISAVEAMACGRPVVACGAGGALESVVDGETGILFWPQTTDALAAAVERERRTSFDAQAIRRHAERFHRAHFLREMLTLIESATGDSSAHVTTPEAIART
jgi:glycosyltransferase involved in cell wall biosynthesis